MGSTDFLTNREFDALKQLHEHYRAAFDALPQYMRDAYHTRLGGLLAAQAQRRINKQYERWLTAPF